MVFFRWSIKKVKPMDDEDVEAVIRVPSMGKAEQISAQKAEQQVPAWVPPAPIANQGSYTLITEPEKTGPVVVEFAGGKTFTFGDEAAEAEGAQSKKVRESAKGEGPSVMDQIKQKEKDVLANKTRLRRVDTSKFTEDFNRLRRTGRERIEEVQREMVRMLHPARNRMSMAVGNRMSMAANRMSMAATGIKSIALRASGWIPLGDSDDDDGEGGGSGRGLAICLCALLVLLSLGGVAATMLYTPLPTTLSSWAASTSSWFTTLLTPGDLPGPPVEAVPSTSPTPPPSLAPAPVPGL